MLNERGIEFEYRDYKKNPLSETEIRDTLALLGTSAREVTRRNDRAYRELGLSGDEPADVLIAHMVEHPTLLQRPIGIVGERAVVGRPIDLLLDLVGSE